MTNLTLGHHNASQAREVAHELAHLYAESYRGTPQEHDPFYSPERFTERFIGYTNAPGFELISAHQGPDLIGYVFGYSLPAHSRWWSGLTGPTPDGFTTETGARTFAINELHVREDLRGQRIASQLHAELVAHRPEERVTILVRPENPARGTYLHWGYRVAGKLQPYPDSPVYDALILERADADRIRIGA